MKAVIDIGSNSVRLLLKGKKTVRTTGLAKGFAEHSTLGRQPMKDTLTAIVELYDIACASGADKIYVFATEAVRAANNRNSFVEQLSQFGISADILTPEQEAKSGFLGAYMGGEQAILDIGGASSELSIGNEKGIKYLHSLPVGAHRLADCFDGNIRKLSFYIKERIAEYGSPPTYESLVAIGGTATTLVSVKEGLDPYDASKVQGYRLNKKDILHCVQEIFAMPLKARYNIKGLPQKRATVIAPGGLLLYHIMDYLAVDECIVSEQDNMEGYLQMKLAGEI